MTNQCQHGQLARVCQICEQAAEIADLRAQVAALEVDAGRYRWLREQAIDGAPGVPVIAMPNGMKSGYYLNFDTADYAIDAALAARKGEA